MKNDLKYFFKKFHVAIEKDCNAAAAVATATAVKAITQTAATAQLSMPQS